MSTPQSIKTQIQNLIDTANAKTGNDNTDLTTAVDSLVEGYGGGNYYGNIETKKGTGRVLIDYINEKEHNIEVQLSSDTITDFSGITVKVTGKNLWNKDYASDINNWDFTRNPYYPLFAIPIPRGSHISISYSNDLEPGLSMPTIRILNDRVNLDSVYGYLYSNTNADYIHNDITFFSNTDYLWICVYNILSYSDTWLDTFMTNIGNHLQIEVSVLATDYEPYFENIYEANAEGVVENVVSSTQTKYLICDNEEVDIAATYYTISDASWHRYWDNFQNYGNKTSYYYHFYGSSWNDYNFKPKYDIIPVGNNQSAFSNAGFTDLNKLVKYAGITVDTSQVTDGMYMFSSMKHCKYLPPIDCYSMTSMANMFMYDTLLEDLELLNIQSTLKFGQWNSPFMYCESLKNVNLVNCQLSGPYIIFTNSKLLTLKSLKNIILSLVNYANTDKAYTCTLMLTSNSWAVLEADGENSPSGTLWVDYVAEIGWNWS